MDVPSGHPAVRLHRPGRAAGILISLAIEAAPVFKEFGPAFLWTNVWNVPEDQYGALAAIYGTVVTSVIALLIAVPVSFGIALFLTESCPTWLRRPLGTAIELLAGVPSIIYGIWGLFVFAPLFARLHPTAASAPGDVPVIGGWFAGPPIGIGILTAGIVLSLMVIPFVASVMRDVFRDRAARCSRNRPTASAARPGKW
jgi:phosphate transport system permease protein